MQSVILQNTQPERLDVALAATLGISRAKAQRAIKEGRVFVHGEVCTPHASMPPEQEVNIAPDAFLEAAPPVGPAPELNIIFENDDVLVVNKPSGLLVHPTANSSEHTLLGSILAHDPKIATVGDDLLRSGIVHRLDKDASGILIVAKTKAAFRHLKFQFANRLTTKRYTVLVMGRMVDDTGVITFPIARSKSHARMAARPMSQDGKEAVTRYAVLQRFANATLLDVTIETGRTHQIRAHFFALGFPVAGDTLYVRRAAVKQIPLGRLFLHARELTIELPSGETQTFTSPLPADLELALTELTTI
jgi:23S rRNA pseudouridine1911/1915/1917 synthase